MVCFWGFHYPFSPAVITLVIHPSAKLIYFLVTFICQWCCFFDSWVFHYSVSRLERYTTRKAVFCHPKNEATAVNKEEERCVRCRDIRLHFELRLVSFLYSRLNNNQREQLFHMMIIVWKDELILNVVCLPLVSFEEDTEYITVVLTLNFQTTLKKNIWMTK